MYFFSEVMNISFVDVSIEVTEGECMVSFMLEKTDGAIGSVSVQIATTDGTAKGTVLDDTRIYV